MYYEPTETYPSDRMSIGRCLGPALDVGTAMTHKILKSNGQVLPRNTVRAWTLDEEASGALIKARQDQAKRSNIPGVTGIATVTM